MSEIEDKRTWPISVRLKEARGASRPKLSQTELAQRVQQSGLAYFQNGKASRLESGYAYATWPEVEAIARVLKVEPHWLAKIEQPPPPTVPAPPPKPATLPSPPVPRGMSVTAAQSAPPPSAEPAPPAPELPPLPIPVQGSLSVSDYRSLLGIERRKAEEAMAQKGLPAVDWRRWREYSRGLNEVLRTLY